MSNTTTCRAIALLLLAVVFVPASAWARAPMLETLAGKPFDTQQLPSSALVIFWSSDCSYCHQEMAEIRAEGDADFLAHLVLVGLLPRQGIDARKYGLPAAALSLASRAAPVDVLEKFGNKTGALPFAVIIDAHGKICQRLVGKTGIAQMRAGLAACRGNVTPH